MIKRIYIDNFRCFSNFEFEPGRINLLVGINGSGKSSFMDVVDRIIGLIIDGRDVSKLFRTTDLTRWDTRKEQRVELEIQIDGETFAYCATLEEKSGGRVMALRDERVTCDHRILFRYEDGMVHLYKNDGTEDTSFPFRGNRSFIAGIEERPETVELVGFLTHLRGLRTHKLEPTRIRSVSQDEQQVLLKDGANFASWFRNLVLERTVDIHQLEGSLTEVLPGFRELAFKGDGSQGHTRDLVIKMQNDEAESYDVDFESVSDGQRALIVLYTLLAGIGTAPRTILLDEPENYVGLAELQPWLQRLDEALGDAGQLFLISHHPEVIDFLAAENPVLFERPGAGPVRVKSAGFESESGLKASEQITRGLFDAP